MLIDHHLSYFCLGRRPFALCHRPDGLPYKAVGFDFSRQELVIDAALFLTADSDPDVEEIDEVAFWHLLRDLGCRDRRINW